MARFNNLFFGHTYFCPKCGTGYESSQGQWGKRKWLFNEKLCPRCNVRLLLSGYSLFLLSFVVPACLGLIADFIFDLSADASNEVAPDWRGWIQLAVFVSIYGFFFGFAILRSAQRAKLK